MSETTTSKQREEHKKELLSDIGSSAK